MLRRGAAALLALALAAGVFLAVHLTGSARAASVDTAREAGKLISAGGYHSLALKADGTVAAWGWYISGQTNVPYGLDNVAAVSAGNNHSLALRSDGTVAAWGDDYYGQGSVPDDLDNVTAVSAGGNHSLALKSNGTVVAWGLDDKGQSTVPPGLNNVVAISAGGFHSLALRSFRVYSWGDDSHGQRSSMPPDLDNVVAASAGWMHSLALKADGTVAAWGDDTFGQSSVPAGLDNVVAVSAGFYHSLALKADGTVVAWGEDSYGQSSVPDGIQGEVVAVSAGMFHSLALIKDGTVVAWGAGQPGQSGFGHYGQSSVPMGLNLAGGRLSSLQVSAGSLAPAFNPETREYSVAVANGVEALEITAHLADPADYILQIDGQALPSGVPYSVSPLAVGANEVSMAAVSQDTGLTSTYTVTINRAGQDAASADLYILSLSSGTLSPAFDPAATEYTAGVEHGTNSIEISAAPFDAGATVTIGGTGSGSGAQTVTVALAPGYNPVPVVVCSANGQHEKTYTVTVVRGSSSSADLSALSVDPGALSPEFVPYTAVYSVTGAGGVAQISITAVTAEAGATLTIGGAAAESGVASSVDLGHGGNLIPVVVTAPDGLTEKAYVLSVNGTVSNANLSSLAISEGTLAPVFSAAVTGYSASVGKEVASLALTAAPSDGKALLLIDGSLQEAGEARVIALQPGVNTIHVTVVAQDGSTKTYTVTVHRAADLTITTGTELPLAVIGSPYSTLLQATGGSGSYTWQAAGLPPGLDLNPATGEISGTPGDTGKYNIQITVTDGAANTDTKHLAMMVVPTLNADLKSLAVDWGTLAPAFDPKRSVYSVTGAGDLTQIGITAETFDPAATLTIGGQAAASGVALSVPLDHGGNLIPIVVTAPDGLTGKAYVLSVNGTVSNAYLSGLTVTGSTLTPAFHRDTTVYTMALPFAQDSIELTAAAEDPRALLLINGSLQDSNSPREINLAVAENTVAVMVVAQDASTRTYTLTVTRGADLAVDTPSLPIALRDKPYSATLEASGGSGSYSWSASGLPEGLTLNEYSGEIGGTATQEGEYAVAVTVTDSDSLTASKTLTLKVRLGTGNGAFIVTPDADPAYSGGLTNDGIVTMTVNSGVSGFKYFSVSVEPVTGYPGDEVLVFVHLRGGVQLGINATCADFDSVGRARAAFNVKSGDVIKVYLVDDLSNDPGSSPVIL